MMLWLAVALQIVPETCEADDSWSFVMMGDTRGTGQPSEGAVTSTGISVNLSAIAAKIATLHPELVLVAGDLCNGNDVYDPQTGKTPDAPPVIPYATQFANFNAAMSPVLANKIPIYTVRGNHENNAFEDAPIAGLTTAYSTAFGGNNPQNWSSTGNYTGPDQKGFSYSFTYKNVTFAVADQYFTYNQKAGDPGYHNLDQNWVTQQFNSSNSTFKVFMAHEPIFATENASDSSESFFGNGTGVSTRTDFWDSLGSAGVQLYLTGHIHNESVANTFANGGNNTIVQLMAGNGGAAPMNDLGTDPELGVDVVFSKKVFGFSLATVRDGNMTIDYYFYDTDTKQWSIESFKTVIVAQDAITSPSAFNGNETASSGHIVNNSLMTFNDHSSAGYSAITNSSQLTFTGNATAGNAILYNSGNLTFNGTSTAGNSTIAFTDRNAQVTFNGNATAGNSYLYDNNSAGSGGGVFFQEFSRGGTAQVFANGYGFLDISGLTGAGMEIGSIGGNGTFLLGNKTLTVGANNLSTTVSGIIQDGASGGVGGSLIKTGSGTLVLSGANIYTGRTTVSAGILQFAKIQALYNGNQTNWTADKIIVQDGATLALNVGGAGEFTRNDVLAISGIGNATGGFLSGSKLGIDTSNAGGSFTYNGVISDTHGGANSIGLAKLGSGTLVLTENNTYTGNTTISGGSLQFEKTQSLYSGNQTSWTAAKIAIASGGTLALNVGGAGEFSTGNVTTLLTNLGGANGTSTSGFAAGSAIGFDTKNAGGSFTVDDVVANSTGSGGGSLDLTKLGSGKLILTGNNTYTGRTTVSAGTLQVGNGTDSGSIAMTSEITNNGTLVFNRSNTLTQGALGTGDFSLISGTGSVTQAGSGTTILTLTNGYTGNTTISGGTLQIGNGGTTGSIDSSSLITNNGILAFNRTNTLTQGTDFASGISGTGGVTQLGSGTTILSGANTYTGITTVSAGTLQLATANSLHNANWTAGKLIVQAGATLALKAGGGGEFSAADVAAISGLGSATGGFLNGSTLGIDTMNSGASFTCNFAITDTNSGANSIGLTKLGTGTLILTVSPTYTGPTTILGGSLQIHAPLAVGLNGLTVSSGTTMSVTALNASSAPVSVVSGGSLSVGGAVTATSSQLSVSTGGSLSAGSLTASSTQLMVDGTLTSPMVALNAGSTLNGNGVINGSLINIGGTVAPGHSPGTLTINGDFTQAGNGTFQLQIASLSNFDRFIVSGRASLGGTLQVQNWAGNTLSYGQQVAFLHAGSISGSFNSITMPEPALFRGRFLVDGGTGSLLVAPASYALVAKDANQRALGRALDHFIPQIANDRETVSVALDQLAAQQYPSAFNAISPAFYEILNSLTIEQANAQTQMLAQRFGAVRLGLTGFQSNIEAAPIQNDSNSGGVLDAKDLKNILVPGPDNRWGVWIQGSGIFSNSANLNQFASTRSESGAMLGGMDYRLGEHLTTGLYSGYQGTYAEYANSSKVSSNGVLFGGYANCFLNGFYSNMIIGGGYTESNVQRDIAFSTIQRTARSAPKGSQFLTYMDFGYDWTVKNFTFGPILSAQYTYAGTNPLTESGADSLNLRVGQENTNSARTNLGVRIGYQMFQGKSIQVVPEIRMFWQHEFLQNPTSFNSRLEGGSGPSFDTSTAAPNRDSLFAGTGVSVRIGERWNTNIFYNANLGQQDNISHMVSVGAGVKF